MCAYRPRLKNKKGCDRCRQRKVKCDELHPTCSACTRLQLPCTWVGGRPSRSSYQRVNLELVPQAAMQPSLTDIACQQFLRGYKFLSGNTSSIDPLYELVEPMCGDAEEDMSSTSLVKAFEAISLAYMGTQNGEEKVLSKAQEEYGKTIIILRRTVHRVQGADISKVLMAVRLCTGFEFFMSDDPQKTGWGFHMKAQATLARKLLGRLRDGSWVDYALFFATFISIAVVHGYARAPMPFKIGEVVSSVSNQQDLQLQLVVLSMRVNDVRVQADQLMLREPSPEVEEELDEITATAIRLSEDLREWEVKMKAFSPIKHIQLRPRDIEADQPPNKELWSHEVDAYKCLRHANLYNFQRCGIIYTYAAIAQVRSWAQVNTSSSPGSLVEDDTFESIQAAVDEICVSAPYYLGIYEEYGDLDEDTRQDIVKFGGGHSSVWFWLATAVGVETVSAPQRDWILGRLHFIGDVLGHSWAKFIYRNPPGDVILGSKINAKTRDLYKSIPGWPDTSDSESTSSSESPTRE